MCGSMADIQSPTAEIRRGKKWPWLSGAAVYKFCYLLTYTRSRHASAATHAATWKKEKKEEKRRKKKGRTNDRMKIYMVCRITQGDYKLALKW